MGDRVYILAGRLCAGKTSLAERLCASLGAELVSAREVIAAVVPRDTREGMQEAGLMLERETKGAWLADALRGLSNTMPAVVDSARTRDQVEALRAARRPLHVVYLSASEAELRRRFARRDDPLDVGRTFDGAMAGELEEELAAVATLADQSIDTDGLTVDEIAALVLRAGA